MALTIGPNVPSSSLYSAASARDTGSERIASGLRINSAADDAAGLALANRSSAQVTEYQQGIRNANDGISLLQTADGSLGSINENLQRFRELALQASSGILNPSDRAALNAEAIQLREEINRIVSTTSFNGQSLLTGDNDLTIQTGSGENNAITVKTLDIQQQLANLDFDTLDLSSSASAQQALGILDSAQEVINLNLSQVGASSNRLTSAISNLYSSQTDAEATRSRIADTDYAREVSDRSRNDMLLQAGLAIQAQANLRSELVLRLLTD